MAPAVALVSLPVSSDSLLLEKAQFAVGLVVGDDAAYHQLVKIAHFDAEEFSGLGRRDQLVRLSHISVVLM